MNYLVIKCIALVSMLLDHIGIITGNLVLRSIGRISFPLFAFLISNGLRYTKNAQKYALRLFLCALISEIPFDLMFSGRISFLTLDNVFFTLLLGLLYLIILDWLKKKFGYKVIFLYLFGFIVLSVFCITAIAISCDYGWLGVLTVVLFGLIDIKSKYYKIFVFLGLLILSSWDLWSYFIYVFLETLKPKLDMLKGSGILFNPNPPTQWAKLKLLRLVSLVPIFLYNGKSGQPKSKVSNQTLKYAFYLFYPVHLIVLYLL